MRTAADACMGVVNEVHDYGERVVDALLDVLEGKAKMTALTALVWWSESASTGRERDARIRRLRKALGNEPQD